MNGLVFNIDDVLNYNVDEDYLHNLLLDYFNYVVRESNNGNNRHLSNAIKELRYELFVDLELGTSLGPILYDKDDEDFEDEYNEITVSIKQRNYYADIRDKGSIETLINDVCSELVDMIGELFSDHGIEFDIERLGIQYIKIR